MFMIDLSIHPLLMSSRLPQLGILGHGVVSVYRLLVCCILGHQEAAILKLWLVWNKVGLTTLSETFNMVILILMVSNATRSKIKGEEKKKFQNQLNPLFLPNNPTKNCWGTDTVPEAVNRWLSIMQMLESSAHLCKCSWISEAEQRGKCGLDAISKNLPHGSLPHCQEIGGSIPATHITPVLASLHWLPLSFRIDFKISLITFKAHTGLDSLSAALERGSPDPQILKVTRPEGPGWDVCVCVDSIGALRPCPSLHGKIKHCLPPQH